MTFLILEGPDGGGKTSLAGRLAKHFKAVVVHHGPGKGLDSRALASSYVLSMRQEYAGQSRILDRSWLSEPVYSEVFRKIPSRITPAFQYMLERVAAQREAVVINCLPPFEACRKAFESGREEMLKNSDQLKQVYDRFINLRSATDLPVVSWDYTTQTHSQLLERIQEASDAIYRDRERVVVVGDRLSPRPNGRDRNSVPFVSFTGRGYSEWLADHLDSHGVAATDVYFVNAYLPDGTPKERSCIPEFPIAKVFAIGNNALHWCEHNGLNAELLLHPQAHDSFHKNETYPLGPKIATLLYGGA